MKNETPGYGDKNFTSVLELDGGKQWKRPESPDGSMETLPAFLAKKVRETPRATVCFETNLRGHQHPVLWEDFHKKVLELARGLSTLSIEPGQRVGLLMPNGLAWDVAQFAIMEVGGVVVGLDPNIPPGDTAELLQRAGCRGLITQDLNSIKGWPLGRLANLSWILTCTSETQENNLSSVIPWDVLVARARLHPPRPPFIAHAEDPAALIFTSGTTGQPKSLLYTHGQLTHARVILSHVFSEFTPSDRGISWLPMVNLFQRMVNLVAMTRGVPYYYLANPRDIMVWIPRWKPSLLVGVPRFYEKVHQTLLARLPRPVAYLLKTILGFTQRVIHQRRWGDPVPLIDRVLLAVADALVLRFLRRIWGGRLRLAISGSAPCSVTVLNFFEAIGLPLLEAYGISENVIPLAINRPSDYRLGSVGKPLPGQEVRIAPDGEVFVRGPGLCHLDNGEDLPLTSDGFLSTKDYGRMDEEGFIFLTGRQSDIIKSSNGRRISLPKLEMYFRQIPGLDQMIITGHGRSSLVAVATRAEASVSAESIAREVERKNQGVCPAERLSGIVLLSEGFSIQRKEMTGNLKLRRQEIERNHHPAVESIYEALSQKGLPRKRVIIREE
jgi:long-chain acyl-CoA synthetase